MSDAVHNGLHVLYPLIFSIRWVQSYGQSSANRMSCISKINLQISYFKHERYFLIEAMLWAHLWTGLDYQSPLDSWPACVNECLCGKVHSESSLECGAPTFFLGSYLQYK